MTRCETRKANWHGMNWIRQDARLAIYLRDGLACAYCGDAVENGANLTLDHVKAYDNGGSNKPTNLVTCCHRCNSSRGKRPVVAFAVAIAEYLNHGVDAKSIVDHVKACTKKDIRPFRIQAKEMIASRGSAAKVLATLTND